MKIKTFSAWATVRGKPSSKKPFAHSGLSRFASINVQTISSETKVPSSIVFLSDRPSSDPDATSVRNKSPKFHRHAYHIAFFLFFL